MQTVLHNVHTGTLQKAFILGDHRVTVNPYIPTQTREEN